jgi:hypothetical protein
VDNIGSVIAMQSLIGVNHARGMNNAGIALLTNTTVSRNHEDGVVTGPSGRTALRHVTVAENGGGGTALAGLFVEGGGWQRLENTIVANNGPAQCLINWSGGAVSGTEGSLDTDGTCFQFPSSSDLVGVDPQLGSLKSNGFTTSSHALKAGSPAIDAGASFHCALTDQRGVLRPVDGDRDGAANCDIGAFEYVPFTPGGIDR